MPTAVYVTLTDLEHALTAKKLAALADDDRDGAADAAVIDDICSWASDEAEGWVEPEYVALFPFPDSTPIPGLLRRLALFYAIATLFERAPEYVKKFGEDGRAKGMRDRAEKLGGQLQSHVKAFADLTSATAANVGGLVENGTPGLMVDETTGKYTGGDFIFVSKDWTKP
jgi:Bacteriophage Mu, Gp36